MADIRNELICALEQEIIGPCPNPEYIDDETGEELLLARVHGSPQARYGAGMLYPKKASAEHQPDDEPEGNNEDLVEDIPQMETGHEAGGLSEDGTGSDEEPVGLANQFKPSAMGFTIRFRSGYENDKIILVVNSARYKKGEGQKTKKRRNENGIIENVQYNNQDIVSDYWVRKPIEIKPVTLSLSEDILPVPMYEETLLYKDEYPWLKLNIFNRTTDQDKKDGYFTMTFTLINDINANSNSRTNTANILFQNELKLVTENLALIAPYPERQSSADTREERELNLLYRKKKTYAIGHGTAVTWKSDNESEPDKVTEIKTAVLPAYEMPQIKPTPTHLEINMYELSDLGNWDTAKKSLENLKDEYEKWVNEITEKAENDPKLENYRDAAINNAHKCESSLNRISRGIEILNEAVKDSDVVRSFRWMNRAMIWQQQRSKTPVRKWQRTGQGNNINYTLEGIKNGGEQEFENLYNFNNLPNKGNWHPFQLAFILMNIDSIINPDSNERDIVDLIWFPTGGGKTEAYLGLIAFSIFYRRLKGKEQWNWDDFGGTTAIMRYTLRLLTTQQYERASSLICGCDLIRQENESALGTEAISIGLWVGGASTPNKNTDARTQFNQLERYNNADYNFIVMKCPCCAAQIGKLDQPSGVHKIKGLKMQDGNEGKVLFQCENPNCEYFDKPLPLNVVDEYIYENPPTLLFGTVDKFAMITWNPEAGKLFGFRRDNDDKWTRITPPELIIQDELHLISGPLGTMVGLYEIMVQTLCNNYGENEAPFISDEVLNKAIPPKMIASTATISRAYEQVKSLYAISDCGKLNIFPAQGLSYGNTWFSEEKPVSEKYPGRKYVGILAPGYPSMQTAIVRAYAAVLQKAGELNQEPSIDYYWTLLGYFNSIRELGGASSLVFSDIRERLSQIHQRELVQSNERRFIRKNQELTSRISSSQIPEILKNLEKMYNQNNNQSLDICLATNMVATGVDIQRLGLMFIHGQPKTTAEYIQASSRVGRDLPDGPGLIMTLYSPVKPRDKSQYEQFYSYHSRIYSKVEPTSVTPFSISARQKALHAIIIGLIRHFSEGLMRQNAIISEDEFEQIAPIIKQIILSRCDIIDPYEKEFTEQLFNDRINFWRRGFQSYGDAGNFGILKRKDYVPLMYSPGAEVREDIKDLSLATPTSLRGVDSESKVTIVNNL